MNLSKDALAGYLVELQGDLSADVAVQGLTKAFRSVEARLDRLYWKAAIDYQTQGNTTRADEILKSDQITCIQAPKTLICVLLRC